MPSRHRGGEISAGRCERAAHCLGRREITILLCEELFFQATVEGREVDWYPPEAEGAEAGLGALPETLSIWTRNAVIVRADWETESV